MPQSKDTTKVLKIAIRAGCQIMQGKKHGKIMLPNRHIIGFSLLPSDRMAHKNIIRDLVKAGINSSLFEDYRY